MSKQKIAVCFKNDRLSQKIVNNYQSIDKWDIHLKNFSKMSNPKTILKNLTGYNYIFVNEFDYDIIDTLNQLNISFNIYKNENANSCYYRKDMKIIYSTDLQTLLINTGKLTVERWQIGLRGYPKKVFTVDTGKTYATYKETLEKSIKLKEEEITYTRRKIQNYNEELLNYEQVLNELKEMLRLA